MRSLSVTGRMGRQGTPAATTPAGMSWVTTLPAPMTEPLPMVTPPQTTALAPIQTFSSSVMGADVLMPSARWAASHRVARAGQADARRDEGPRPDVDGRGVQDDAVVVDDGKAVGVDVEAVITVKGGLDEGQVGTIPQQLLEDFPAAFRLIGRQLVVGPAQPLGFGLPR